MRAPRAAIEREESRLAAWLITPTLAFVLLGSILPIVATGWEALHGHDLRLPWLGRPFIGLANFAEAAQDPRFTSALERTIIFAIVRPFIRWAWTVITRSMYRFVSSG